MTASVPSPVPHPTSIPGLVVWDLPVHRDGRGWFKENWQREKMVAAGLPDFRPVQNNVSFNDEIGVTRGIHAEPWDKWVSVATGRVFCAWVDLREGPGFGAVVTAEIGPDRAVFVPRGVGNAYQTLEHGTAYIYLVNDHWSPGAAYAALNPADETTAVPWPIPLSKAAISEKDLAHPRMADVIPVPPRRMLVLGADGQLGRALRTQFAGDPAVEFVTREDVDVTSPDLPGMRRWRDYGVVVNATAFTAVDAAETSPGRETAWSVNAGGVAALARVAADNDLTIVHVSSDYVFDGSRDRPYLETDPISPLGVYGQTKAAGDAAVSVVARHYIVRTSWVIGKGANFVTTMADLAARGVDPRVVDDQVGRLTFADDLARGIRHLLDSGAPFGTYNLTSSGEPMSWADVARHVFATLGHDPARVTGVSTTDYSASAPSPVAPRPRNSLLDLGRITSTGFEPASALSALATHLARSDHETPSRP